MLMFSRLKKRRLHRFSSVIFYRAKWICFVFVTPCLWMVSCQLSVAPRAPTVRKELHSDDDLTLDLEQIRLRMRSLVDPMCGEVETAADKIIASTEDPQIKRAALEWKAEAVPALREALFQPGPLRALFDTWVLTNQMAVYYSNGPGFAQLGDKSPIAVDTCLKMERQIRDVAASMTKSGDVTRARAAARSWAVSHPIKTRIAHRESTLSRDSEVSKGPLSATETLSDMTMTVDDLNRKIEVYTEQLFKQIRWEAKLLSMNLSDQFKIDQAIPLANRAVDSVDDISDSVEVAVDSVEQVAGSVNQAVTTLDQALPLIERAVEAVEKTPDLIAAERAAAIQAVQEELTRTIQFVREEREVALQHITGERLAAIQALHDSIASERKILTEDIRAISEESIDHAFWRTTQLVAAVLVVIVVILLVGLWIIKKILLSLLRENMALQQETKA